MDNSAFWTVSAIWAVVETQAGGPSPQRGLPLVAPISFCFVVLTAYSVFSQQPAKQGKTAINNPEVLLKRWKTFNIVPYGEGLREGHPFIFLMMTLFRKLQMACSFVNLF